ncbi:glutamine synthetase family protein [Rhodospirillum rubrum]|uniref:L-glutamine synthetase n=1 Tax=Rhodospirillum rubrum (strain ATCC 11170 / ATH 1.1.1 / DSM 467 / LMG 4362 / NCIMB 8255 / S1) TaxID=269796 RepID=Q2RUZ2_RHORT|nr:glutamine synthetase family protein [Rhodospirillum rubrum]ABC22053.1 L-glutamine synthetase [Rhodospirillum rubrum ATCC 11170]AEO47765.1 L-glutamine synthetase [Rhodospirillum rubrum F11]MBK5953636.1 glutamine synthetase [Rhodospirillum rubrum]QXG81706.1 glutamine synthetase family protein [Rhodospirillum rubrum]HAQ00233.1 glutamine synthetase [Rhodospirillum rubrum]
MINEFEAWINEHGIAEVECLLSDMNGIVRGKVLPARKFLRSLEDNSLRIPSSVFLVTVTGEYPFADDNNTVVIDPDADLRPDFRTLCVAPGYRTPTAFVVVDAYKSNGIPLDLSPRQVLKRVLALYSEQGWKPVVAPEIEFYLTQVNADPDLPLSPPAGRSGRPETSPQPYGLEAITEFEDLIENIYEHAEIAGLQIDTLIHEAGAAQLEINFLHGDPITLSDQVVVFKRLVRQVALKHGVYATFMAKPMADQPGSAMHIHQSLVEIGTGKNLFVRDDGSDSPMFRHYIGGLQALLAQVTPLFAPNINSFRRMRPHHSAPINLECGYDNRSCGLRVPLSDPANRRLENRLPGADANPYLAMAASLACGYIGIMERIEPSIMVEGGNAYRRSRTLPRTLDEALDRLEKCTVIKNVLGEHFFEAFTMIKRVELDAFQDVISSWERNHLLLKV